MKDKVGLEATSVPDSSLLTFALIISDNANPTELVPSEPRITNPTELVPSEPLITLLENFKELCQNRKWHTDNADLTDDRRFFFIDL